MVWTGSQSVFMTEFRTLNLSKERANEIMKMYPVLGYVKVDDNDKIKSIEKVEIRMSSDIFYFKAKSNKWNEVLSSKGHIDEQFELLSIAEKVGFKDPETMFKFLEEYAPEIKERPMPFWLIGLEWIE